MKKLLISLFCLSLGLSLSAQELGSSCERAFAVEDLYKQSFLPGEYWFSSTTLFLPLRLTVFPEDTTAAVPHIFIDLTCEYDANGEPVYEDSTILQMMEVAYMYGFDGFPMEETPKKVYVDGKMGYQVEYNQAYRDMLYDNGVTYEVPAYVRVVLPSSAVVDVESMSIHRECKDSVMTLLYDTEITIYPRDTTSLYIWPIGEWINEEYTISWEGEGQLDIYESYDCNFDNTWGYDAHYNMSETDIQMNPRRAKQLIKDRNSPEVYIRLYPQTEGLLKIHPLDTITKVTSFYVAGVYATIDQEAKTITALLPTGTNRNSALRAAEVEYYSPTNKTYNTSNGFNRSYTKFSLGEEVTYTLDITVASESETGYKSVDASLSNIFINDVALRGFNPCQLVYDNVDAPTPCVVTATATDPAATFRITQAPTIPGTATILVTAEAGNTQTYVVHLIKARSQVATLSSLTIDGELVEGFNPNIYYYEVTAKKLPVIDATATDPKAKLRIYQVNRLPGYAQVQVTAEAGNTRSYTINFLQDPIILQCSNGLEAMSPNFPVAVAANEGTVQRITAKAWKNEYLCINWDGADNETIYVLPTCETTDESFDNAVATFTLKKDKDDPVYFKHYLRPVDMAALAKKSLDGNLYLAIKPNNCAGNLMLTSWSETCETRSMDWDVTPEGATYDLPAGQHATLHKLYKQEFLAPSTLRFIWSGSSTASLYLAKSCNFILSTGDTEVLQRLSFQQDTDTIDIPRSTLNDWAIYDIAGDYMYTRCDNDADGTIQIIGLGYALALDTTINVSICQGSSYTIEATGQTLNSAQTVRYDEQHGDTTYHVTLNLTIEDLIVERETLYAYETPYRYDGQYAVFNDRVINSFGETTLSHRPTNDCWMDLVLILLQKEKQLVTATVDTTFCEGKYIFLNNEQIGVDTTVHVVTETVDTQYDTEYRVHIIPADTVVIDTAVASLPFVYGRDVYREYGTYIIEKKADNTCTVIEKLIIHEPDVTYIHKTETLTECIGQDKKITLNGVDYTTDAIVIDSVQTGAYEVTITEYHLVFTYIDTVEVTVYNERYYQPAGKPLAEGENRFEVLTDSWCYILHIVHNLSNTDALVDNTLTALTVRPTIVAPNENITVSTNEKGRLVVMDILGRVVLELANNNHFEFSLAQAGNYILRFATNESVSTTKLIVK